MGFRCTLFAAIVALGACSTELENTGPGDNCDRCDDGPGQKVDFVPAAAWLSCWTEALEVSGDLDPTHAILCNVDSDIAYSGSEELSGLNSVSVTAMYGDTVKQSGWTRNSESNEIYVGNLNPQFDFFPIELTMTVSAFAGHEYVRTLTINSADEARADSPAQLLRPYDLWRVELGEGENVRILSSELNTSLPIDSSTYSFRGDSTTEMSISVVNLPQVSYFPVLPGSTDALHGTLKSAYKAPGESRVYNDFELTLAGPGTYTVTKDGIEAQH